MDLPVDNDALIIGTGLVESMVAASLARVGKKVLQVDSESFYGSDCVSFTIRQLLEWASRSEQINASNEVCSNDQSIRFIKEPVQRTFHHARNVKPRLSTSDCPLTHLASRLQTDQCDASYVSRVLRGVNIDLNPKVLYARDSLTSSLVKSGACKYCEFVTADVLNLDKTTNSISKAFYSRADIFASKDITLEHKRSIMRFIKTHLMSNEDSCALDPSVDFSGYLNECSFPANFVSTIETVCTCKSRHTSCKEAIERGRLFCQSVGVYSNSPYLWTHYGTSDLCQACCRTAAVHGAVYCLQLSLETVRVDGDRVTGITLSDGKDMVASFYVVNSGYIDHEMNQVFRSVQMTTRSILPGSTKNLFLHFLPDQSQYAVEIVEQCIDAKVPLFVIYAAAQTQSDLDLACKLIRQWTNDVNGDSTLLHLEYNQSIPESTTCQLHNCYWTRNSTPKDNFFFFPDVVSEAERIFKQIAPDEEFMMEEAIDC